MNSFFYEFSAHEKVRELTEDGMRRQALSRSRAGQARLVARGMQFGLSILVGLGVVVALITR